MIIADLKDFKRYCFENDKMQRAFKFLQETNLEDLVVGKHLIDGENIFALVQSYITKEPSLCLFESHERYIDIQFIVSGIEKISWIPIDKLVVAEDDLIKSDKLLYKDNSIGNEFIVHEGQFVVFYPEDGHKACVTVDETCLVKKIVLKVSLT
jgi:biofilm protein TabA